MIHCKAAEELLKSDFDFNMLFLDVALNNRQDSIKIGRRLLKAGNAALFALISSHNDLLHDSYTANAFRYLVKPITFERIFEVMDAAIKNFNFDRNVIVIKHRRQAQHIHLKDIIYAEYYALKCYLVIGRRNSLRPQESWEEIFELLSKYHYFYSPRPENMINFMHITSQSITKITMSTGRDIYISPGRYEHFIDKFTEYVYNNSTRFRN